MISDGRHLIEGRICSQAKVGARNIVADGCRQDDDRDLEFRILVAALDHQEGRVEGLESTDHQDSAYLVISQLFRNLVKFSSRQGPLRAELGAADGCPPVDRLPREVHDVSFDQSLKSILDSERSVTRQNTVADK